MKLRKVQLVVLAAVVGMLAVPSIAGGWFSKMGDVKDVTLTELLRNPRDYVDVDVRFKVYFNSTGGHYNPYFTRFSEEMYGNFSAWPLDARLYDKRDFQRSYTFFFMRRHQKGWKKIQGTERFEVLELVGTVRDVFKGQPWIEVIDYSSGSGGLDEKEIRSVIVGDAQFVAGHYDDAADSYEYAVKARVPESVSADLWRKLADAQYQGGHYRWARDSYREALDALPGNEVLQRGLRASEVAVARERGRDATEVGVEPAPHTVETVQSHDSGVDEIIRLLEDPAAVEAEVEGWKLELEKRAAALRGDSVPATAVSGEGETAQKHTDGQAPVAVEEGCAEAVVEEGDESAAEESGASGGMDEEVPAEQDATEEAAGNGDETVPTEGCDSGESVEETPAEQPTEETAVEETPVEQPAEETAVEETPVEQPVEQPAEQPAEETAVEETPVEQPAAVEQPAEEVMESAGSTGTVVVEGAGQPTSDPYVVQVGDVQVRVPRLPFFGCEHVTLEELRAVVEDVLRNPEHQ